MDTSKEYIKMCEQAEEIQQEWKPFIGDIVSNTALNISWLSLKGSDWEKIRAISNNAFLGMLCVCPREDKPSFLKWLPRQDQLQDMVKCLYGSNIMMIHKFNEYIAKWRRLDNSMEMHWLDFVMFLGYNKTWNGKEWLKAA